MSDFVSHTLTNFYQHATLSCGDKPSKTSDQSKIGDVTILFNMTLFSPVSK